MKPSPSASRRSGLAVLLALLALLPMTTIVAQGAFTRNTDHPGMGIGGRVFGLGVWRNELIVGLNQRSWRDGNTLDYIGRYDGVRWSPIGSGLPSRVRAVLDYQGVLYAAGLFGVRRWSGSTWSIVGAGLSGEVRALEEFQGQLHACGDFVFSGSTSVRHIARFDGTAWQPLGAGLQSSIPSSVQARDLVTDGQNLYVGGKFERAGNVAAFGVARWDGSSWHAMGSGIPYIVHSLALFGGRLYVGGNGIADAGGVPVDGLAVWNGQAWGNVGAGVQYPSRGATIDSMTVFRGELYVAGSFQFSGPTTLHHIARLSNNQLVPIGGVELAEFNPPTIFTTTVWNDQLFCGGEFRVAGDIANPAATKGVHHLASFDGQAWRTVGDGLGLGDRGTVLGLYQGTIVIGGAFLTAGGNQATHLARFDGNDWRHFGTFDAPPRGMVELNGELWVVGEFYHVDSIPANGVARFDGSQWHAVGMGLGPSRGTCIAAYQGTIYAGGTGSPLQWNGSSWQTFATSIGGIQAAMHVHQNRLYIASFNAAGSTLSEWDGVSATTKGAANGVIESIATFQNDLVVGGRFTQVNGVSTPAVARFNGSAWAPIGAGLAAVTVKALTTFQGQLVAAGDVVSRWNGTQWAPLSIDAPLGTVWSLLAQDSRGELHMCGDYFRVGSRESACYSVYQSTPHWTDVPLALPSPRRTPSLVGDGSLLSGARVRWRLSSARENSIGLFFAGTARVDLPLVGGTLVPSPDAVVGFTTDAIGTWTLELPWLAAGLGVTLWTQAWIFDVDGPQGVTGSNAVWMRAP